MTGQSIYHTYKRYRTLQTHHISALPIAILMPHSACNCRCVMCDIWKDNKNLKQLTENDITGLLGSFKKLGTKQVVMSGGEALLNPNFFRFCEILKERGISVSLLSTGLTLKNHARQLVENVEDIIVSLDGDEPAHNAIRNIPDAYQKLKEGISAIHAIDPGYRITARTVIQRLNFRSWPALIKAAAEIGISQLSFLPADVSSHAFNRMTAWAEPRQNEVMLTESELPELKDIIVEIIALAKATPGLVAESPEKLQQIHAYYAAFYGLNPFPFKKCNAPWVSVVIESDGSVLPCFFHGSIGNIRNNGLEEILNSPQAISFRRELQTSSDETCSKCVCSLNLHPASHLFKSV